MALRELQVKFDMSPSERIDIHSLTGVRLRAFWILDKAGGEKKQLSATEIAKSMVDDYGIATSRQAVDKALKNAKDSVHKTISGYKLMQKGRKELEAVGFQHGNVSLIEPNKPFTAKKFISDLISKLSGEILICDPYIDARTLDVLVAGLDKQAHVKLLTQRVVDKTPGSFLRVLNDLKKEGFSITVRVNKKGDIHDRYLMDHRNFWFSGNSLNHLGEKESMILALGQDVRIAMKATFEKRWATAIPIV